MACIKTGPGSPSNYNHEVILNIMEQTQHIYQRYRYTWEVSKLEEVITILRSVISTYSERLKADLGPPSLASSSNASAGASVEFEDIIRSCRLQLAAALGDLFEHDPDNPKSVEEQVRVCEEGLEGLLPSHPQFSAFQHWRGFALCRCYETTNKVADLDQAITVQRAARRHYVKGFIAQSVVLAELSYTLVRSFQRSGSRSDLAEAAALARQAIDIASENIQERPILLIRLAYALIVNFMANGQIEELKEAERISEHALSISPGHRDRHRVLGMAAMAHGVLYEQANDIDDIERAIKYLSGAIKISFSLYGNNLALALQRRFSRKGEILDLERSIQLSRQTLEQMPPDNRFRDYTISNLSFSLRHLYLLRGNPATLEEAIKLQRQGVERCTLGDPQRFVPIDNLAKLLLLRFRQNLDTEDLLEAIRLWREALALQPQGRPNHGAALCQLADGLVLLFEEMRDVKHLHEAIDLHRQLRQDGNPNDHRQGDFLFSAGKAYYTRFRRSLYDSDLEESIQQHRASLTLRPTGHPDRHRSLHELASGLRTRYELADEPVESDIEEATSLQEDALDLLPTSHPDRALLLCGLARMYLTYGSPLYSVTAAMEAATEALTHENSSVHARIGETADVLEILDDRVSRLPTRFHPAHRRLLEIHILAIRLLPSIANFGLDIRARLRLLYQAEQTTARAARIATSLDELPTAIEILEEGRAVFWAQYLRLRMRFDDLPPNLSQELLVVANQLEMSGDSRALLAGNSGKPEEKVELEEQATKRRLLNEKFGELLLQARSLPGYERYLLPATYEVLSQAAGEGIIVILIPGETKSQAIMLNRSGKSETTTIALSLPITSSRLMELSDVLQNANLHQRHCLRDSFLTRRITSTQKKMSLTGPRNLLSELWDAVVAPVFRELRLEQRSGRQRPRLWWCATGVSAFLPIHAAGAVHGSSSCSSSYVVSSYTPTLSALLSARQKARSIKKSQVNMLLVGVPHPCEGEHLQEVTNETRAIKAAVPSQNLMTLPPEADCSIDSNASATVQDVVSRIADASFLHLACHGRQDPENALDSGFAMKDRMMTVAQLMSLKLPRAFLAFLSACDTARGDERQPDQAMHLAAAMFFVGFPSVVGTMWSIGDIDGPLVAKTVYEELFSEASDTIRSEDVPYALDNATQKLRDQGLHPSRWAPYIHLGL